MNKGLSIRNKFILVAIFIFVVLISFSVFLISLINQLANVTSDIIDHPLEVSNAASYANVEVMRMHRDLKDILLVTEDYEINILVDKIRVAESKVYVALDTIAYDILGEEGKALEEEARVLFDEWKAIRSEIIDAVRDKRRSTALEITRNKGSNHIERLERKLLELNQYARKKAVNFQENSINIENNTERTAVLGILAVLVFVSTTIIWMSWSVLGGIGSLSASLNDIMRSGEFKSVALSGNDELTALSVIFNDLVSSLGLQLWQKEGLQKFNNVLSQGETLNESVDNYLEELHTYAGYLSVAYYHSDGKQLNLMSVVNRMTFMESHYAMGYKFVGECAETNKERIIEYKQVHLNELPYKKIILLPASYDDEVYGVVIVVCHHEEETNTYDLLKESIKDFSIYVSTYEHRKKIDDLLEESIRTNEKLTNRQSRLEENQEELEAVNRTLQDQRDLLNDKSTELESQNHELINLREELVKKYKDLEEVTKYRSQFLTNISHELRTPLNSIIVLSNMLKEKDIKEFDGEDEKKINVITKASNDLLLTINNILDLSKVENGKVELHEEVFYPDELMKEWQTIYEPLLNEKGLLASFKNNINGKIYCDKSKLSHIVTNFLSNAIKFTNKGFVETTIESVDDIDYPVKIEVKDSGIGINKDKLEDIFLEFVQTDGSISRMYGGTGLGLSICKNYARLINSKIQVSSELGEGSTFALLLPSTVLLDDYSLQSDRPLEATDEKAEISKQRLKPSLKNKCVLICDDEPMNVFSLSAMLEDIGVEPIASLSSDEAIEALRENSKIEMLLMDYMMPGTDGFATLKSLKEMKEWESVPIAIITAANLSSQELLYIKNEGYILIKKPIIYNELVQLLNENL